MKRILVNCENLQTRIALIEEETIQDYNIERGQGHRIVGAIFKGKIRNLEPSLQAAFVDIGLAKNAFLHYWDMIPATQERLEADDEAPPEENSPRRRQRDERDADAEESTPAAEPQSLTAKVLTWVGKLRGQSAPAAADSGKRGSPRRGRGGGKSSRGRGPRRKPAPQVSIEEIPDHFKVNSDVVVQVTKGMIGGKGPRVTTNLSIPGRYVVLLPNSQHRGVSKRIRDHRERGRLRRIVRQLHLPPNMGCICRTAGTGLEEAALQQDVDMVMSAWQTADELIRTQRAPVCVYQEPSLVERTVRDCLSEDLDEIVVDDREIYKATLEYVHQLDKRDRTKVKLYDRPTPIFEAFRLERQIQDFYKRKVTLPSGAELCLDETEALIAIDINSGKSRGGKDHPETILNTNLEAADEIARQLRLRNVGGLVVVDFIDMRSRKDQMEVYRRFRAALSRDRAKTRVLPISKLGLLEMTRQRENESLQDAIFDSCSYCNGRGRVKSATTISVEIQRRLQEILRRNRRSVPVRVTVHPAVLRRLKETDAGILQEMEVQYGGELSFRGDDSHHEEEFHIVNMDTGKEL